MVNHKSKRCQMKNIFSAQDKLLSTAAKQILDCVTPSGIIYLDCHLPNIVYLIICSRCSTQYVAKIDQKINGRFSWHKVSFKNSRKYGFYQILSDHFHKGVSKNTPYVVQILEKLDGNREGACVALDVSITSKIKQSEKESMLNLRGSPK